MIRTSFNDAWFVRRDGLEATTGPVVLPYDAMLREHRDPDAPAGMNTGFYPGDIYRCTKTFHAPVECRDGTAVSPRVRGWCVSPLRGVRQRRRRAARISLVIGRVGSSSRAIVASTVAARAEGLDKSLGTEER